MDTRPTMDAVRDYAEVLQAEAEELGLSTNSKIFAPVGGTSATPVIKALQASPQDGTTPLMSSTSTRAPCRYWRSKDGCKKGALCTYLHDTENMRGRCWACGGLKATSKETVRTKVKLAVVVIWRFPRRSTSSRRSRRWRRRTNVQLRGRVAKVSSQEFPNGTNGAVDGEKEPVKVVTPAVPG